MNYRWITLDCKVIITPDGDVTALGTDQFHLAPLINNHALAAQLEPGEYNVRAYYEDGIMTEARFFPIGGAGYTNLDLADLAAYLETADEDSFIDMTTEELQHAYG